MFNYHLDYNFFDNHKRIGDFELLQLGRILGPHNTSCEEHLQRNYYELTIITNGSGSITTNGISTEVKEGDIYISFPADLHEIKSSDKNPLEYDFFTFTTFNAALIKKLERIGITYHNPNNRVFSERRINFLINNLILEIESKNDFSEKIIENLMNLIIMYLLKFFFENKKNKSQYRLNDTMALCYKIMHYIDINIYNIKKLEEISQIANYNYSYLSNLFKKNTGKTISEYYKLKRLETAKYLLNSKELKANEVSEMLNYESYFSFSRAFKLHFGLSPKNYKALQKN